MNKHFLAKLVSATAEGRAIDPRYWAAVILQESSGYMFASRYEPHFYTKYIGNRSKIDLGGYWPKKISEPTERKDRATSFGLCQIMGQVARENGFAAESLNELFKPKENLEIGAKHFAKLLHRSGQDYHRALILWNGSKDYANKINEHVKSGNYKRILLPASY